jgi:hypothetical protein
MTKIKKKYNTTCKTDGCYERAYYGYEFGVYIACSEHRIMEPENLKMVNVKGVRCVKCKITLDPAYGFPETNEKTHCFKCKEDGMENLKDNKMCIICDETMPNFGLISGKANATHCFKCKTPEMFNVVAKMCFCGKFQPSYGLITEQPTHCRECKLDDMTFVLKVKKCFCGRAAPIFGLEFRKPTHCKECKTEEMDNVKDKKCFCGKVTPCFGLIEGKPTHCISCKTPEMKNVKNKKCKVEGCNTQIWNPCYEGYCTRCFFYTFPDKPISRNYKTKEKAVVDFVEENFELYNFIWDRRVEGGCSLRRPDLLLNLENQVVIIEIDENKHYNYECICENKRLMEISQDINHKNMVMIRFNPDKYVNKNNKTITSCWSVTKDTDILRVSKHKKKEWNERLEFLKDTINYWIENETDKTIEIIQLFYDQN